MSGEETEVTVDVSADVADLLDELGGSDADREETVRDLLDAYWLVSDEQNPPDRTDLDERLESQREEYVDLVEDVRERVIQVKRETDGKAVADHDHSGLAAAVEATERRLDEVESSVEGTRSAVERLEADLEAGFGNYEDVLTNLTESVEEVEDHLALLARAVVDARETTRSLAADDAAREAADRLKVEANREGVRTADCEDCGESVDVSLLVAPECPHCRATFTAVEGGRGFFGSPRLVTGAPALESETKTDASEDLSEMTEESAPLEAGDDDE